MVGIETYGWRPPLRRVRAILQRAISFYAGQIVLDPLSLP